jgi:hypothetical protein
MEEERKLLAACEKGDMSLVVHLLDEGINVDFFGAVSDDLILSFSLSKMIRIFMVIRPFTLLA